MALTNSYLTSVKNFESIMNSILNARAPERFTTKFLEDLGFKSSTDRLIIGVLKAVGLLDDSSQPTQRYYEFLDQSQSKRIIAKGIQEAYEDLFNLRVDAQNMTNEDVKNKLKTLTQGQKSDRVIEQMALTFRTLCNYADWSEKNSVSDVKLKDIVNDPPKMPSVKDTISMNSSVTQNDQPPRMNLHYNIQIHLPETRDMAVYDAIFQSLKKHLY
jgi:hypothetical protein